MNPTSPLSLLKSRQTKSLKRASSCPDIHQIAEIVSAKNTSAAATRIDLKPASSHDTTRDVDESVDDDANDATMLEDGKIANNAAVQTDEFLVSPYEHLFPFVLPQWLTSGEQPKTLVCLFKNFYTQ